MNTQLSIEKFSRFIQENKERISPQIFAEEFGKVQRFYLSSKQRDTFCFEAEVLAEKMIEDKNPDFAGIILSSLCKLTQYIPELLEIFATRGYYVAKSNSDTVHMMARLNDLRKIYYRVPDKLSQYLKVLYKQEKCLKELTRNYDKAVNSYQTVSRHAAQKRDYELMLAHVQTEIGKITKRKHPVEAKERLLSARETFETSGYEQNVQYIKMLLDEIKCCTQY